MNGWLVCAEKDEPSVDLDRTVTQDAKSWLLTPWEIETNRPAFACGRPFHTQARAGHCFTDFWAAYQAVIPADQHTAAGKETGETAHVERWNTTLRQRLARFVRKTLSFSRIIGDA